MVAFDDIDSAFLTENKKIDDFFIKYKDYPFDDFEEITLIAEEAEKEGLSKDEINKTCFLLGFYNAIYMALDAMTK